MQWIIKIAQDRGSSACLAIVSSKFVDQRGDLCKLTMQSFDGQQVSVSVEGDWQDKAARVLARAGGREVVLLSGIGAKVPSSGSEIIFESGRMVAEVINAGSLESQGRFEVKDGRLARMPRPFTPVQPAAGFIEINQQLDQQMENRDEPVEEVLQLRTSPPTEQHQSSPFRTPLRDHHSARQAASETPAWLKTPAIDSHIGAVKAISVSSSRSESERTFSVPAKTPRSTSKESKMLGTVSRLVERCLVFTV